VAGHGLNPERIWHIQCLPHHRLDLLFGARVAAHPVGLPGHETITPSDRLVELREVGLIDQRLVETASGLLGTLAFI
jgi:hypothetical protein